MRNLISVIIPVYNVEKYLKKCVKSICRQTYSDLEIILVNDGSTDESALICERLKEEDKRICVIHKENEGAAGARNTGLEAAKGTYIIFVDADDFVDEKYLESMYMAVDEEDIEAVVCSYQKLQDGKKQEEVILVNQKIEGKSVIPYFFDEKSEAWDVPWNKLYKKSLFETIKYPLGRLNEDEATIYRVLYEAKAIKIIDACLYYYVIRNGSASKREDRRKLKDEMLNYQERRQFCMDRKQPQWADMSLKRFYYRLIAYIHLSENEKEDIDLINEMKKEKRKLAMELINSSYIEIWSKIGILLTCLLPYAIMKRIL